MAFTAAMTAVQVGVAGYGIYKQSKQQQQTPTLADLNPPNTAHDQMKADAAAVNAGIQQRKKTANAKGYGSTILTGPQGVPTPAPQEAARKTLLGQ